MNSEFEFINNINDNELLKEFKNAEGDLYHRCLNCENDFINGRYEVCINTLRTLNETLIKHVYYRRLGQKWNAEVYYLVEKLSTIERNIESAKDEKERETEKEKWKRLKPLSMKFKYIVGDTFCADSNEIRGTGNAKTHNRRENKPDPQRQAKKALDSFVYLIKETESLLSIQGTISKINICHSRNKSNKDWGLLVSLDLETLNFNIKEMKENKRIHYRWLLYSEDASNKIGDFVGNTSFHGIRNNDKGKCVICEVTIDGMKGCIRSFDGNPAKIPSEFKDGEELQEYVIESKKIVDIKDKLLEIEEISSDSGNVERINTKDSESVNGENNAVLPKGPVEPIHTDLTGEQEEFSENSKDIYSGKERLAKESSDVIATEQATSLSNTSSNVGSLVDNNHINKEETINPPKLKKIKRALMDEIRPMYRMGEQTEESINKMDNAVLFITAGKKSGTGFLIHPDGYALTCYHVIKNSNEIRARFRMEEAPDPNYWTSCELLFFIEVLDIALLKLKGHNYPYLTLAQENREIKKGERVAIPGYPLEDNPDDPADRPTTCWNVQLQGTANVPSETNLDVWMTGTEGLRGHSGSPIISMKDGLVIGIFAGSFDDHDPFRNKTEWVNFMRPISYFWDEIVTPTHNNNWIYYPELLSSICNISIVAYKYGWNRMENALQQIGEIYIRISDGMECYERITWAEPDFGQFPMDKRKLNIMVSYEVNGEKRMIETTVNGLECGSKWKVGAKIDANLNLLIYLSDKDESKQEESEPLSLKQ